MSTHNDHISFTLWGCSPASILLLEDLVPGTDGVGMYQIIIGRNSDSDVVIAKVKVCELFT